MEMSTEDSRRTHRRHSDCMEQPENPEKPGKMNSSPLPLCQCVLRYFGFGAIWLQDENGGVIT